MKAAKKIGGSSLPLVLSCSLLLLLLTGCSKGGDEETAASTVPVNQCTNFESRLMSTEGSTPRKLGVTKLYDFEEDEAHVIPKEFTKQLGQVTRKCKGFADFGEFTGTPIYLDLDKDGNYFFYKLWDYEESIPKEGLQANFIAVPKDRACQIPQENFNRLVQELSISGTMEIEKLQFLIDNLESDSLVISTTTDGPDTYEVPAKISGISLGFTQAKYNGTTQGFVAAIVDFAYYCRK